MSREDKKIFIETYGCQMNVSDTEIVRGLLNKDGLLFTKNINEADVILVNTCSVREHAERRVYGRLGAYRALKKSKPDLIIGILGCMAERLRSKLNEEHSKDIDLIVGPDEYRKLSALIDDAWHGEKGIAVKLSRVETYDDITPLRTNNISAWISIMRGCDKFCSFCVVPYTRGRERSRSFKNIIEEARQLSDRGFKEITLLGQNVNSYKDGDHTFPDLLEAIAQIDTQMRIRFTTSHPQDMSDKLINTIASYSNICKHIHLPVQSGSDRILSLMNRNYNASHYKNLVDKIFSRIKDVSLSTDIISGFPTEREEDHKMTLELMEEVQFDGAFMFKYSPREKTAAYALRDDVPEEIKTERINQIINLQNQISNKKNEKMIGKLVQVLVEGVSKKSKKEYYGRTDGNKVVIFPGGPYKAGDYIEVKITRANSATLFGEINLASVVNKG